ncbi:hypothetical protein BN2537_9179 [Streptomyces venezuelae]|nr:hypothetical protein BN2537_9179 [Streptomyces venezuelae]
MACPAVEAHPGGEIAGDGPGSRARRDVARALHGPSAALRKGAG